MLDNLPREQGEYGEILSFPEGTSGNPGGLPKTAETPKEFYARYQGAGTGDAPLPICRL
jgi:hypothetical protein